MTFGKDIAPIVFRNCAPCHRPGESAPFSLLSYQDAKKRAGQIALVTKSRYMPPWLPEPGYGDFVGQRRLSDAEINLIQQWVEQGAAEGDLSDLPPQPQFPEGWQLGKPDLVVTEPRPYTLPASGKDVFWNFIIPVPVAGTRYVKAVELRPGNKKIVHHANILIDRTGSSRRLEASPGAGFGGMDLEIESEHFDPDSHFLFWKPGTVVSAQTDGMPWRLDKGTDLVLNMHMRPSGKPELIQPVIGLYFTDKPPTKFPMLLQLERDNALDIPGGSNHFVVTDDFKLPVDVEVFGVYPHAHYLGKDLQGFATLPDGTRKWLIWIKDWNLDWQAVYPYREPLFLPKGTTLHMRYTYDNSADNVRNPNHPPKRVVAGNQSTDEMGHLWLQVLPLNAGNPKMDPRLILQEALMRHRARTDPGDYLAHYNLGAALQTMSRLDEAAREYREALRLRPGDAIIHNSLGAALQAMGKSDEAGGEYREALRLRPEYGDAHYNLGQVLLSQNKLDEAATQFREVLRIDPDDAGAHNELGSVFFKQGNIEQATVEFEQALRIDSENADAHNHLGYALASQGSLDRAAAEFEEALRINPGNADAHYNLGSALVRQGNLTQAIAHFEQALRINPENADVHNDLGTVFARQGSLVQAVAQFEEALRLNPQLSAARQNLEHARAQLAKKN